MTRKHLNLLIDTNVWLDYFLGRKASKDVINFLNMAMDNDDVIATTPSIMKDVFFIIENLLKSKAREEGATEKDVQHSASAIKEIAWQSLTTIQHNTVMLCQGFQENLEAIALRGSHNDYEDDLLLATVKCSKIDYLITGDKNLLSNQIVPAITPKEYLKLEA